MGYLEIFLTGIALAMDAFAVSICKGIKMPKLRKSHIVIIAVFFGGFQMLMPLIGWLLGSQLVQYIEAFDHWIAFALLAFIGGKMIFDIKEQDVHAGGSGCGCAASVLCSYILPQLQDGRLKNILFIATGAMMSPTSVQQGESIPGIAHLLHLSHCFAKEDLS